MRANCTSNYRTRRMNSLKNIYGHLGAVVGAPLFDPINRVDSKQVREDLHIPKGKKVVLFSSPVLSAVTPWRFAVWREPSKWTRTKNAIKQGNWAYLPEICTGSSFMETVKALRDFCDRQDAFLIIKSRVKQEDPRLPHRSCRPVFRWKR